MTEHRRHSPERGAGEGRGLVPRARPERGAGAGALRAGLQGGTGRSADDRDLIADRGGQGMLGRAAKRHPGNWRSTSTCSVWVQSPSTPPTAPSPRRFAARSPRSTSPQTWATPTAEGGRCAATPRRKLPPFDGTPISRACFMDVGDVSWITPTVQAYGPTWAIGTPGIAGRWWPRGSHRARTRRCCTSRRRWP